MANNKNKDSQKDTSKEIKIEDNSQETIKEKVEANEVETDATNEQATDEINELKEQLASLQDKYLRQIAEFDNYRKRTLKEKMELVATGCEDVIKAMLTVMDDIDRALAAMETAKDVASVRQGVLLIHQKLMDTLRSRGVEEIEALGRELDTDLHEAVAKVPVEEKAKKGKIIDVVQKGYKLKDKVTRFAKVVVGE